MRGFARAAGRRLAGFVRLHANAHGTRPMAAYLIAEHIITDSAKFEEYRTKVGPMIGNTAALHHKRWNPQATRGRPLESGAGRDHRVSEHGGPEQLVQLA